MPLAAREVTGILADNLRMRGSVLPVPSRRATRWATQMGLRKGGPTVLYTGMMYRVVPYVEGLNRLQARIAGTPLARYMWAARLANKATRGYGMTLLARPSAAERAELGRVPANVARLLQAASVDFGYLYEDDLYTGALVYDLGSDEVVGEHARRVAATLRKHGVSEVITIDPHTTTMLRSVFPKFIEGYDIKVRSYLEVLTERGCPGGPQLAPRSGAEVVIHDSCVYARYEDVVDQPRQLLAAAGVKVLEPGQAGRQTWCCGGPAESLYPDKALAVAAKRAEQLRAVAPTCVTMCPICLVTLRKAADQGLRVRDISEFLVMARAKS
ncbi:MAG TPA: (Fe-S)-binding protein [Acidimicrobiales bacterium]|nr:(Fe-S)-binding protein [Acidimicrobiales bacterium]